jgi:hypothetical protein|tara:strand:+ start:501 stop:1514 length:1014 start_codon:yes stop_codon:yes gene_type:complete
MATYVNNLRLKEIATGDESGTWGTSTNTNLELIGEALGFGTEAITTNADTHTTTIADGSSDAGRALFLKYTGTLDSACTITIGPNTMKRVHIIENATSGSQNIIISQGSGANITIGPGDTKVVYLDGAGSGAAVVDAFVDLDLSGGSVNVSTVKTNSGDMTFDSAGDIILDADGADLIFKDGGTTIAKFINSSSDFVIATDVDDKDFIIKGQDSTSEITALTIDMSAAGAATFNNDVTAFSDERLKEDIKPIENGLDKVMQLQGVSYKRNDVSNPKTQIGVIAQQVEPILPEVVLTAEDDMGTKSVDYAKMTAVLIEAVKELKQEITELKQQIINGA